MSEHQPGDRVNLQVFRGDGNGGEMVDYDVELAPGMVVLDAIHRIQAEQAPDLACRWNCKAGKCGSCSAEVNGHPVLMCMTRMKDVLSEDEPVRVRPVRTFPLVKDLVTDVSWNYRVNESIDPFQYDEDALTPEEREKGEFRMQQEDVDRIKEFRKCIECFLCQNVCHVLREHEKGFMGPRFTIRVASLEMHPKDTGDRLDYTKNVGNLGYCNITKCCTDVCPENIEITDNGIIPMKERVAADYYDPIKILWNKATGKPPHPKHQGKPLPEKPRGGASVRGGLTEALERHEG